MERLNVVRIVTIEGERNWVEATLKKSIRGTMRMGFGSVTALTVQVTKGGEEVLGMEVCEDEHEEIVLHGEDVQCVRRLRR